MNQKDDWDLNFVADNERSLIPAGKYVAQCIKCERSQSHHNSLKLFLTFSIIDGAYLGTELFMAVSLIDSKTKKPFRKVRAGSKYYQQWMIANHNKRPNRNDRMSPKIFQNGIFEISVRTVKPKYPDGKADLPEGHYYSIADYIISRKQ